jgi:hypothetical protein
MAWTFLVDTFEAFYLACFDKQIGRLALFGIVAAT